jgi:nitrogen-specific signal transduction histidine kinase
MNRQAFRSVAHAENNDTGVPGKMPGTSSWTDENETVMSASTLAEDGKEIVQRSYDYASRTIRENPTLALAGLVAVGALAALVFIPRRSQSRSIARNIQRDLSKHTRDLRKAVRHELRNSGTAGSMSEISKIFSNIDLKPYVQPLVDQASTFAQQASSKLTGK